MPHSKGFRHKTRSLLRQTGGMRSVGAFLRDYQVNDKVVILIDASEPKGMPHRRYHGRVGVVKEVRRRSLVVAVRVGGKVKHVITRLNHVRPHMEAAGHA